MNSFRLATATKLAAFLAVFSLVTTSACSDEPDGGATPAADGGAVDGGTDAGGTDDATATDTATTQDTGSTTKDAGTTGPVDAGKPPVASKHNSFDTALPITLGAEATAEKLAPVGELDYFTFEGKKGEAILIGVQAQETPFDKDSVDTVVTLFDADQKQIAENDDPLPRFTNDSQIFTILPKDGTYYVVVTECWTWVENKGISASCAEPKDKPLTSYSIFVGNLNVAAAQIVQDAEKGNEHADFTAAGYAKTQAGGYFVTRIFGTFSDDKDVDWYRLVPPTDINVGTSRLTATFEPHPHGKSGTGATSAVGWAAVSLADAPTAIIAKVDMSKKGSDLWVPVKPGAPLLLSIKHPGTGAGSNDFYFLSHQLRGDNPLEKASATNDDVKTPEALSQSDTTSGLPGFFVAGDITDAPKDVDHYEITIPAGYETGKITVACSAQRAGSGLRGFTMRLLKADGSEISGAKWVEDDTTDASIKDIAINNEAKMILKVEAKEQAAGVSSTYYRCGSIVQK